MSDRVNHPSHYGGADNPWEARKVIRDWGLGFNTGNVFKYVYRFRRKHGLEDLEKAMFYMHDAIDGGRAQLVFDSPHLLHVEDLLLLEHYVPEKMIYRALWLLPEKVNQYTSDEAFGEHMEWMRSQLGELITIVKAA
jgi:hypothetical protein